MMIFHWIFEKKRPDQQTISVHYKWGKRTNCKRREWLNRRALLTGGAGAMDVRGRGGQRGLEPERAAQPRRLPLEEAIRPGDQPADAHRRRSARRQLHDPRLSHAQARRRLLRAPHHRRQVRQTPRRGELPLYPRCWRKPIPGELVNQCSFNICRGKMEFYS